MLRHALKFQTECLIVPGEGVRLSHPGLFMLPANANRIQGHLTLAYSTIVNTRIRFLLLILWKTNSVALVLQTSVMADREMSSQCVQYRLFRGINHLGFHSHSSEFTGPGYP